jgi:hypothetical protein
MRCPNCNNKVLEDKNYCGHCGYRLVPAAPEKFDEEAPTTLVPIEAEDQEAVTPTPLEPPESEETVEEPTAPESVPSPEETPIRISPAAATPPEKPRRRIPGWIWALLSIIGIMVCFFGIFVVNQLSLFSSPPEANYPTVATKAVAQTHTADSVLEGNAPEQEPTQPVINPTNPPNPQAALVPSTPKGLIYSTNYDGFSDWPVLSDSGMWSEEKDGLFGMGIHAEEYDSAIYLWRPDMLWEMPLTNFYIRITGIVSGDADSCAVGLALRSEEDYQDGSLIFQVRPYLGNYSIVHWANKETPIVEFQDNPSIYLDDDYLSLEVIAFNENIEFLLKGEQLDSISVGGLAEAGLVGVAISVGEDGWCEFYLSELEIWE